MIPAHDATPDAVPTARWGPIALGFDASTLTAAARRAIEDLPGVDDVQVEIHPGEISILVRVRRMGLPLSARAELSRIRFRHGRLSFVLARPRALGVLPVPDSVISAIAEKARPGLVSYDRAERRVEVDLTDWMPPGLDLSLEEVDAREGEAEFRFAPGHFDLSEIL